MLDMAARAAWRGMGDVEPNPMVGCVIGTREGEVIAVGHHRRCGGDHAEVEALRRAGPRSRGAIVWVTLEPCGHTGKTPPCVDALVGAGVAEVVIARKDPHPDARGGGDRLFEKGVRVRFTGVSARAVAVSDAFVHRVETGRPWVIAKWAMTADGRVATRTGESKWISGEAARARVHRLRARVDAVVTGIGTALADDPLLTARGVRRVRRVARRVVVDPSLRIPETSQLVRSAGVTPLSVVVEERSMTGRNVEKAERLRAAGVGVEVMAGEREGRVSLEGMLAWLGREHGATRVMVEAGPGLTGAFVREGLVDEAWAFVGGKMLGDERAPGPTCGSVVEHLSDARPMRLVRAREVGGDAWLVWKRIRD
ncbi:MAG: bifunctional diaminohydroxyphosphoribosylaminopyrimidine deaminase/5-amino-6-(5-phosphoribosylamino)uracil reductase RibD [Phycisphaerales bacterium]